MRPLLPLCVAASLLVPSHSFAQATAAPNLAQALARAKAPSGGGVAISVDADRVPLPKDGAAPDPQSSVTFTGNAYGRSVRDFGPVTAVAPPTMVVINASPSDPNPFDGMPASDALALLCAGLSDGQWQALVGAQGLEVADLATDSQRQLFQQLLSGQGKLKIVPKSVTAGFRGYEKTDVQDVTDQVPQGRLRLSETVRFDLPTARASSGYYPGIEMQPAPGDPPAYKLVEREDYGGGSDTVYGVKVRAEEPNEPKESQLDYSSKALQAPVSLAGVKTVGDLIFHVSDAAKAELYADPRLEARPLVVVGGATAPAGDLLRALAFCVTGTFRQVGTAFVLTDDIAGIGQRRQTWYQFEQYGDGLRRQTVYEAETALFSRHSPRDLSASGDPLAYTPDQDKPDPKGDSFFYDSVYPEFHPRLSQPLSKYTPAQQAAIRRQVEAFNQAITEHRSGNEPTTPDKDIGMESNVTLQLLLPSLDGPVDMDVNEQMLSLFSVPPDVEKERMAAIEKLEREKYGPRRSMTPPKPPPGAAPVTFAQALAVIPRRAALLHVKDAAQVDADIVAMEALGLNQLWLDVFSGGHAHIPGVPLSDVAATPPAKDILTEALARTKGTGIRVFPVLDLLAWGDDAPQEARDLTILGETSAQATARWQQLKTMYAAAHWGMRGENTVGGVTPGFPGTAACPQAPEVRRTLRALVAALAARPGVAGLVWRATDPPGYDMEAGGDTSSPLLVGYHESMRLAFLRKYHADPIDVFPEGTYVGKANTDVPNFSSNSFHTSEIARNLDGEWRVFRSGKNIAFLRDLWAAANPDGTPPDGTPPTARRVILIHRRRRGQGGNDAQGQTVYDPGWYGSWDAPTAPLPTLHSSIDGATGPAPAGGGGDAATQAAAQSRVVYTSLPTQFLSLLEANPAMARDTWRAHPLPGLVLDFSDAAPGDDPLLALAKKH